jgi:alpha-1,2-mannosyltransferase
MAWEHHYGIVLALFAWIWFAYAWGQQRRPWLLGVSFFLTTNFLSVLHLIAIYYGGKVLQSYMYLGALLLLGVLCATARAVTRGEPEPVP